LQRQVESLQQNITGFSLNMTYLKKANELLKKGLGVNPAAPEQSGEDPAG
jgi:putative transposase